MNAPFASVFGLCILLLVCGHGALGIAQESDDLPDAAKAYCDARERQWERAVQKHVELVQSAREKLRTEMAAEKKAEVERKSRFLNKKAAERYWQKRRDEISELDAKSPDLNRFVPRISNLFEIEVGDAGKFVSAKYQNHYCEVLQVIDESNALVLPVFNSDRTGLLDGEVRKGDAFWLRGIPTKGFVDGKLAVFNGVFYVSGTTRYGTIAGAERTVLLMELFDVRPYLPSEEELAAREEAKQKALEDHKVKRAEEEQRAAEKREREREETAATGTLRIAKDFIQNKDLESAKVWLEKLIKRYPNTRAAIEARELLEALRD